MKARFNVTLFALGLLMVLFACSSMDNDTVATINGNSISLEDFTSKNPATRFAGKDHDFIDGKVDEFVRKALFTQVSIKNGAGEEPEVLDKKRKAEKRQMLQYVYDRAIVDEVMTEAFLKEMYDRSGTELNARHILLQFEGTSRSNATRTKEEALAVMGRINNRLSKGETFEDLAKEFTDDPSGKDNGGDLGWFGWGKMVGPFQETAFKLQPGEVSDVVETPFGFHIIKLEAKRDVKRGSFEDEKQALKQQARKEKGQELGARANTFLEEQKKAANFSVLTENVHSFFEVFQKSSMQQAPMDQVFKSVDFDLPVISLNGEDQGSDWIVAQLADIDEGQKPRFNSENQLLSILDQLVTQTLIVEYGYTQGYDKESAFADKITELVDRYAYDAFVAQEINQKMEPSEEELLAFYDANKAEKYMDKKKVQVNEIFVKDSLLAVDLKKRIDAGEKIESLAGRYSERKATKDSNGLLPPFQEGRYGVMGKKAFTMNVGEIAGPLKLGNGYSVIQLVETIPEGPKPYEKVKGRVRTEITGEMRTSRTQKVFSDLKKANGVKINYAAVHAFYDAAASE